MRDVSHFKPKKKENDVCSPPPFGRRERERESEGGSDKPRNVHAETINQFFKKIANFSTHENEKTRKETLQTFGDDTEIKITMGYILGFALGSGSTQTKKITRTLNSKPGCPGSHKGCNQGYHKGFRVDDADASNKMAKLQKHFKESLVIACNSLQNKEIQTENKVLNKQIKNILIGITQGFSINLELKGIGYTAKIETEEMGEPTPSRPDLVPAGVNLNASMGPSVPNRLHTSQLETNLHFFSKVDSLQKRGSCVATKDATIKSIMNGNVYSLKTKLLKTKMARAPLSTSLSSKRLQEKLESTLAAPTRTPLVSQDETSLLKTHVCSTPRAGANESNLDFHS